MTLALLSLVALVILVALAVDLARWHRLSRHQATATIGVAMLMVIVGALTH